MFKYASLTKQGMALIAQATNLKRFIFTRMEYGNGVPEGFSASKTSDEIKAILCEMTSLVSKKADIGMYNINVKNNCATLVGKIISSSLTEDFFAKELGIFAKIDDGSDVLVAYFVSDDKPDPINQAALVGQEHKVVVDVAVGNAANITIEYSDGVYVTQWEFNAFEQQNADEHKALQQSITDEVTAKIAELVANAPEDLDTLKEISDWITEHANSAAEMNTQIIKNQDDIKLLQNKTVESCPVGTIMCGLYSSAPTGFLLCNGQEVSISDYQGLYSEIGSLDCCKSSNAGMFKLPNLQDRVLQGANKNLGTMKEAGLPNITADMNSMVTDGGGSFSGAIYVKNIPRVIGWSGMDLNEVRSLRFDASRSSSIYGKSSTVQPPAVCVNYIIKY